MGSGTGAAIIFGIFLGLGIGVMISYAKKRISERKLKKMDINKMIEENKKEVEKVKNEREAKVKEIKEREFEKLKSGKPTKKVESDTEGREPRVDKNKPTIKKRVKNKSNKGAIKGKRRVQVSSPKYVPRSEFELR